MPSRLRRSLPSLLFGLVLVLCSLVAHSQNVRYDGVVQTRSGSPAAGAFVAVCGQPANTTVTPCTPTVPLCSSLTDVVCNQPNPLQSDGLGNFHFYVASSHLPVTFQWFGSTVNTYAAIDQFFGGFGAALGLNNTWTGTNTFTNAVTMSASVILGGSLNGITVLGTQGGAGSQGYIQFGTGSFTQNTLSRFDSSGDLVNSFLTDSGAILAYSGVNGDYAASFNTNGSGSGFIGISQGTLPLVCNGGVDTMLADSVSTLMVDCKNLGGNTYYAYEVEAQPYFNAITQSASIGATVLQAAAPAGSEWTFHVNVNQVPTFCSNATGGQVIVKLAYTDSGGVETPTVATLAFATSFTGANSASGVYTFRVNSTNNISYQTTWTNCTTGTGTYDIHGWMERVQ